MRPIRLFVLVPLLTTGLALIGATESCSGDESASSGGTSTSSGGDAGADADGGDSDADGSDVVDAPEEPIGEPGWVSVSWKTPCKVEVAKHPELAVPKLTWGACPGNAPGCEAFVVNWEKGSGPPLGPATTVPWGDGYRVGAFLSYPNDESRSAVFDVDGTPLIVWRNMGLCQGATPRVGPTRVWYGVQGDSTSAFIVGSYDTVGTAPESVAASMSWQDIDSNDTTLSIEGVGGTKIAIYDRLGDKMSSFGPDPGYQVAHPVADSALMLAFSDVEKPEAWIWNRSNHATEPLIQPAPEVVLDIRSDGSTIAWLQVPPKASADDYFPPGNLWTSPFATTKAGLQPQKRRAIPMIGGAVAAAGQGYYAMYASTPTQDRKIHVYRLSDAQHWEFVPPAETFNIRRVTYVDPKYVWYWTITGVYRQALDALGPGDPPP